MRLLNVAFGSFSASHYNLKPAAREAGLGIKADYQAASLGRFLQPRRGRAKIYTNA
jgi:hypothetical protein